MFFLSGQAGAKFQAGSLTMMCSFDPSEFATAICKFPGRHPVQPVISLTKAISVPSGDQANHPGRMLVAPSFRRLEPSELITYTPARRGPVFALVLATKAISLPFGAQEIDSTSRSSFVRRLMGCDLTWVT